MPLAHPVGLRAGMPVRSTGGELTVSVGDALLGRVLDGLGRPIDGRGPIVGAREVGVHAAPPPALDRARVDQPLPLGVRALDTLVPAGRGQRFGLFAGSGVGKSSLLSMIARGTEADVVVLALVGERGREVREFLEDDLGPEGLARSVVVVATSDEPALVRLRAATTATRIAEHFRDAGPRRRADDGLPDPFLHGTARDRPVGGGAACDARLPAVDLRAAPASARAGRPRRHRLDHRHLHRARGR